MKSNIIITNFLLIILLSPISIQADPADVYTPGPSKTEKLIRWNVIGFGISKGTGGAGLSSTTLGIDFFFPEYKIGVGSAIMEWILLPSTNMDTPERMIGGFFPIKLYVPIYYKEWGSERFKFVNTIDLFGETSWMSILGNEPISLNCGIEWCPGLLTNFKIGYARIFRRNNCYTHDESSIYASVSLFFGVINKSGGEI